MDLIKLGIELGALAESSVLDPQSREAAATAASFLAGIRAALNVDGTAQTVMLLAAIHQLKSPQPVAAVELTGAEAAALPEQLPAGIYWVRHVKACYVTERWVTGDWETAEYKPDLDCWYSRLWGGIRTQELSIIGPMIPPPDSTGAPTVASDTGSPVLA